MKNKDIKIVILVYLVIVILFFVIVWNIWYSAEGNLLMGTQQKLIFTFVSAFLLGMGFIFVVRG